MKQWPMFFDPGLRLQNKMHAAESKVKRGCNQFPNEYISLSFFRYSFVAEFRLVSDYLFIVAY